MIVQNGDNTRLIEFMNELGKGMAIEQTYQGRDYKFYKENGNVLIYLNSDVIGHLEQNEYGTYEELTFVDWGNEKHKKVEWLGEVDAYLFNYEA